MNKAELIDKLAEDAGVNKKQATAALDSFTDTIAKTLKRGTKLTLVGFGTFSVSKRAARTGRNPQTGAASKSRRRRWRSSRPARSFPQRSSINLSIDSAISPVPQRTGFFM